VRGELLERDDQMPEVPTEAVETPDDEHVNASASCPGQLSRGYR
jgi:hypothetical protein